MRSVLLAAPLTLVLAACGDGKTTATDGDDSASTANASTGPAGATGTAGTAAMTDATAVTTDASGSMSDSSPTSSGPTTTGGLDAAPSKYSQACAPDDGAAVEFRVGIAQRSCDADFGEDAPIFTITLYQGVGLAVGEHKLDGGLGIAQLDDGDGTPLIGQVGTVTVLAEVADGLVGTYDITMSDSTELAGSFDAIYCPMDVLCG